MGEPAHNLAWLARHHFSRLRAAVFVCCLCPALWLSAEWASGSLGANPLNRLLHATGGWALSLLLVTLMVTPARRLSIVVAQAMQVRFGRRVSDWNRLIRLRRMLGLFAFFYAAAHAAIYLGFDAALDAGNVRADLQERPFMLLGMGAFVVLVPLAATSNKASMRTMGRWWRRLHLSTYLAVLLALAHVWMQLKVGQPPPARNSALLLLMLLARGLAWTRGDRGAGVEAKER